MTIWFKHHNHCITFKTNGSIQQCLEMGYLTPLATIARPDLNPNEDSALPTPEFHLYKKTLNTSVPKSLDYIKSHMPHGDISSF
jgi:hypothetical protein